MAIENKFNEITIKTNDNVYDFLVDGSEQIMKQIANIFNLDKTTIETVYQNFEADETATNKEYCIIKTIKYKNIYLGFKYCTRLEGFSTGITVKNHPLENKKYKHNQDSNTTEMNCYNGVCIEFAFIQNKNYEFYDNKMNTFYHSFRNTLIFEHSGSTKDILNFNFYSIQNTVDDTIIFYNSYYFNNSSIFTGLIYVNDNQYILRSDANLSLSAIGDSDNENYYLDASKGIVSGNISSFYINNENNGFVLPCYVLSEGLQYAHVNKMVRNMYKTQGLYNINNEYVLDGTMYLCIASKDTGAILFNEQKTYEDWRYNND